jgi:hypothetical protein
MAHVLADQFCHGLSQRHSLFLQTFSHSTLTSVDGGTNSDFRIFSHDIQVILLGLEIVCKVNILKGIYPLFFYVVKQKTLSPATFCVLNDDFHFFPKSIEKAHLYTFKKSLDLF